MDLEQAMSIFQIKKICSLDELKKIYRDLAKKYHPDLVLTTEEQAQREIKMQEINFAYGILKTATEEDLIKTKKRNWKKQLNEFLSNLEKFDIEKAKLLQEFLIDSDITQEEISKFLYRFVRNRKNYYYEKTSSFLFRYYYDEKVFTREDFIYLKLLCEKTHVKYIANSLSEINAIVQQAVIKKVSTQKQYLSEYASLDMYPYTEQQKNALIKILRKKNDINIKKKTFLKASLYFQIEESILNYVSNILQNLKEEERTYARKQLLLTKTCDIVEKIVDLKIYNEEINFTHSKKILGISLFFSFSKSLKRNTNIFLLNLRKAFENNDISLTEEELRTYGEKLYFTILEASHEKVIEPPQYTLRNKRVSFKYQ